MADEQANPAGVFLAALVRDAPLDKKARVVRAWLEKAGDPRAVYDSAAKLCALTGVPFPSFEEVAPLSEPPFPSDDSLADLSRRALLESWPATRDEPGVGPPEGSPEREVWLQELRKKPLLTDQQAREIARARGEALPDDSLPPAAETPEEGAGKILEMAIRGVVKNRIALVRTYLVEVAKQGLDPNKVYDHADKLALAYGELSMPPWESVIPK